MRVCIFGDSIIWGAFLPFRGAWSNLLRNHLENIDNKFAVYDLGIDSDTSRDVLNRFEAEATARQPEILIFAVGVNDSANREPGHKNLVSLDSFRKNIEQLIEKGKTFTEKILFVGLAKGDDSLTQPLPRSTTGKSYSKEDVKKYNEVIREVCGSRDVKFVDIYNKLEDKDFDDGLHPNLEGHKKIFELVKEGLEEMLNP